MKFKVTFNQQVDKVEQVEAIIEATSYEEAEAKYVDGDFKSYLVTKSELVGMQIGTAEFEELK